MDPFVHFSHFRSYFFVIAVILVLAILIYTQFMVKSLREEDKRLLQVCANLYAVAAAESTTGAELNLIFDQVIKKTNFPIILTDQDGTPQAWKGVGILPHDRSKEAMVKLRKMVERMDSRLDPIPLQVGKEERVLGYLHYGDSSIVKQVGWMPCVEVAIIGLFVLISFLIYRNIKRSEQRFIWVGMAKETAHQLGTPLSSLMGWLELIKGELSKMEERGMGSNGKRLDEIVEEMGNDVDRLSKIASRFGQIGSVPKLKEENLTAIISDTVGYFRSRLPQLSKKIEIHEHYGEIPPVQVNRVLIEWVLENLFRNAMDAIERSGGWIEVSTRLDADKDRVCIIFKDGGRGMSSQEQRNIFSAGYTTKKRGWGLGLTLAKRIVEEYHGGKLFLKESKPNQGSTFMVELPVQRS